ncbi:MAG: TetR/AcrR family transcriptional regulator, partial [Pseudomonadales bacterium]
MAKNSYHHGNLREALLQAARELLVDSGVDSLSLRKIAKMAGVSATAPYSHFQDKQAVLAELATAGFDELANTMEQHALPHAEYSEAQLEGLAQGYVSFAVQNPALFQLMFGPTVSDLLSSASLVIAGTRAYQLMESAVVQRIEATGSESNTHIAAAAAWSMVHGVSTLLLDGRLQAGRHGLPEQQQLVSELCCMLKFT